MRIKIVSNYEEMSKEASKMIAAQVKSDPHSTLGLATGGTPIGTYKELIRMHREKQLDFSNVVTFNLDEYVGLSHDHPQSYHHFMYQNFFNHVNIDPNNIHMPDGLTKDIEMFCKDYEQEIKVHGGIDIQLLGIGRDGHIAFNEPGSSLGSRTRLVVLAEETISDNARFFEKREDVPLFAISMGCATIMEAKRILLLAEGRAKAEAVSAFIEGAITSRTTASVLQLHPNVTVIIDEAAASSLKRLEYYRRADAMLTSRSM